MKSVPGKHQISAFNSSFSQLLFHSSTATAVSQKLQPKQTDPWLTPDEYASRFMLKDSGGPAQFARTPSHFLLGRVSSSVRFFFLC
jgi:hypothetical protein